MLTPSPNQGSERLRVLPGAALTRASRSPFWAVVVTGRRIPPPISPLPPEELASGTPLGKGPWAAAPTSPLATAHLFFFLTPTNLNTLVVLPVCEAQSLEAEAACLPAPWAACAGPAGVGLSAGRPGARAVQAPRAPGVSGRKHRGHAGHGPGVGLGREGRRTPSLAHRNGIFCIAAKDHLVHNIHTARGRPRTQASRGPTAHSLPTTENHVILKLSASDHDFVHPPFREQRDFLTVFLTGDLSSFPDGNVGPRAVLRSVTVAPAEHWPWPLGEPGAVGEATCHGDLAGGICTSDGTGAQPQAPRRDEVPRPPLLPVPSCEL